jgi:hypothetical protein
MPGVFAAGDARYRSIKRVASAVGDGASAVRVVQEYLAAEHGRRIEGLRVTARRRTVRTPSGRGA